MSLGLAASIMIHLGMVWLGVWSMMPDVGLFSPRKVTAAALWLLAFSDFGDFIRVRVTGK